MPERQIISILRLVHGSYNLAIILLFWYQAFLGFRIRKARRSGGSNPKAVRRHRQAGPVLAIFAIAGYVGGLLVGFLDHGPIIKYPLHLFSGTFIVMVIVATVTVSRRITYRHDRERNLHFSLGLMLLCLYAFQAFLGIGILL
jgi:uncharacterized membrane protein YfcA